MEPPHGLVNGGREICFFNSLLQGLFSYGVVAKDFAYARRRSQIEHEQSIWRLTTQHQLDAFQERERKARGRDLHPLNDEERAVDENEALLKALHVATLQGNCG